eukprot:SAG31_NODE_3111_length_4662_cov_82.023230_1_plen_58_part_10
MATPPVAPKLTRRAEFRHNTVTTPNEPGVPVDMVLLPPPPPTPLLYYFNNIIYCFPVS